MTVAEPLARAGLRIGGGRRAAADGGTFDVVDPADGSTIAAVANGTAAVDGALVAKMRNVGEACTAANRFCVERPVAPNVAFDAAADVVAARFGGVKQSGLGREGGHEGLLDYTEVKYFAIGDDR